jgi:hypothetical protein
MRRGYWNMKVLVHLNHGVDKSYLLNFGKAATKQTVNRMLKDDKKDAVESLLKYALIAGIDKFEITPAEVKKTEFEADFTVSQHGYTSERLA